jgi:hypothetical protein
MRWNSLLAFGICLAHYSTFEADYYIGAIRLLNSARAYSPAGGGNTSDGDSIISGTVSPPARGPEVHSGQPFGQFPHIHIGHVNHLPLKP